MILSSDRIVFIKAMELYRQCPKQMTRYTQAQAEELALKILRRERVFAALEAYKNELPNKT